MRWSCPGCVMDDTRRRGCAGECVGRTSVSKRRDSIPPDGQARASPAHAAAQEQMTPGPLGRMRLCAEPLTASLDSPHAVTVCLLRPSACMCSPERCTAARPCLGVICPELCTSPPLGSASMAPDVRRIARGTASAAAQAPGCVDHGTPQHAAAPCLCHVTVRLCSAALAGGPLVRP